MLEEMDSFDDHWEFWLLVTITRIFEQPLEDEDEGLPFEPH